MLWDKREHNENSCDEDLMKSGSNHQNQKTAREWLVDASFACCVDMSVLDCLLQVNSIRKTCGVAFV